MKNVLKLSKFIACDLAITTGDGSDQSQRKALRLGAGAIDVSGRTIDQTPRNPSEEVSTSNLAPRPTFWSLDHTSLSNNACVCQLLP